MHNPHIYGRITRRFCFESPATGALVTRVRLCYNDGSEAGGDIMAESRERQ